MPHCVICMKYPCPELDALVEIASSFFRLHRSQVDWSRFWLACTVNLVEQSKADEFVQYLSDGYLRKTGLKAAVFITHASRGAYVE